MSPRFAIGVGLGGGDARTIFGAGKIRTEDLSSDGDDTEDRAAVVPISASAITPSRRRSISVKAEATFVFL